MSDIELESFKFSFIADGVGKLMTNLSFTEDELADMDAKLGTDIALLEVRRQKNIDQMERRKKTIREDLAYIRSNKLSLLKTGVYSPETLLEEETKLSSELNALQNAEQASDIAMHETMKDIAKLSELIKDVVPYYGIAKPLRKEQIIRVIFSELYVSKDTLKYKLKKGFECFGNRFNAICDPTGSRTRL
jgi:hypothetical protein